ncbi:MAG: class II D-tagatose-bisphosphate aldolase, non-catalytic subunit, partial [Ignavibacteriaceae bacterium]
MDIIKYQKSGTPKGITSICSSNKFVLETAMLNAKSNDNALLIESTSNQVDQFGGYSGMTPEMFRNYVWQIADEFNYQKEKILLGGDHLGPNVWQSESVDSAMQKAEDQIRSYVKAGFTKIHLDTSFPLGNENEKSLSPELITERATILCEAAEDAQEKSNGNFSKPLYVIGTDVPKPGGAMDDEDYLEVTPIEELQETIAMTKSALLKRGLEDAWDRVIAVVVQPGVEFTDTKVFEYDRMKTSGLKSKIEEEERIVLEAHSTDYQTKESLRQMVEDHFGILKVGPWLTFAFRESVFALEAIEKELFSSKKGITPSQLSRIVIEEMNNNPKYWQNHYRGNN